MVLYECACANLISKANFNLINRTDLFICLHLMFQISFRNSKGQKSYRKFLGVRSELLLSIYCTIARNCKLWLYSEGHNIFKLEKSISKKITYLFTLCLKM